MTIDRHLSTSDLKIRAPGNLTPEQKAKWDAAYGPKNKAFQEANLQGDELFKWKYQRYVKDYLRCIDSVDENIGRLLDYLDKSGRLKIPWLFIHPIRAGTLASMDGMISVGCMRNLSVLQL